MNTSMDLQKFTLISSVEKKGLHIMPHIIAINI